MDADKPQYAMTRKLIRASKNTAKVNIDRIVPFQPGDVVKVRIEDLYGMVKPYEGFRTIYRSGNSRTMVIPMEWGFFIGDTVRVFMQEVTADDSGRGAEEGD